MRLLFFNQMSDAELAHKVVDVGGTSNLHVGHLLKELLFHFLEISLGLLNDLIGS